MDIYGFIYKITNTVNGKIYVGQHKGSEFGDYWGSGVLLHRAYAKYGVDKFTRSIIAFAYSKDELNRLECQYIQELGSFAPAGYNIATGGRGGYTGETTVESRRKISRRFKGQPKTAEHRRKLSEAKKGKPGHKHTEESRRKISEAHKGLPAPNKGKGKEVIQLAMDGTYIKTWKSLHEAGDNGFNVSKISECANGNRKHHKGYLWRFSSGEQSDSI